MTSGIGKTNANDNENKEYGRVVISPPFLNEPMVHHKLHRKNPEWEYIVFLIITSMELSPRTFIKLKNWTKLIRSLPEGANELPTKFCSNDWNTLKQVCLRENKYESSFSYIPSIRGFNVTITKIRRSNNGESS
jgi:hypothetical protein